MKTPMQWKKTTVVRAGKQRMTAVAPVIISASRATDIPAFYADWLIHRLKAGYSVWHNPFNQKPCFVSFEAARLFVFWSKNPRPLMSRLGIFENRNLNYFFQFTLNDYEEESFEPGVPPLRERIDTFRELSGRIGKERVIWRFDPLIVTPRLSPERLLEKIENIGRHLMHKTGKLVVSFVDVAAYQKVRNNLIRELDLFDRSSVLSAEPSRDQIRTIARGLQQLRKQWHARGWDITLAACAESMDLAADYGIVKNKCIDDDLIRNLFPHDRRLMQFVDEGDTDPDSPRQTEMFTTPRKIDLKDRGQRNACGCIYSKDIGMYNTCRHFCVYCYANASRSAVNRHRDRYRKDAESLG
jgi:hypothetical protein